jgi:Rrf2 family nitric oxide-sensitive transcriptional repressor
MQLTLFSDYALRTLLYLAMHEGRLVAVDEISAAYGISRHHLVKVVQLLVGAGAVASVRGRGGGLRLAVPADALNVGRLVRTAEPHLNLVECFDRATNTCPIVSACGLKGVLQRARDAFFAELDQHTLADFLPNRDRLVPLWRKKLKAASPG